MGEVDVSKVEEQKNLIVLTGLSCQGKTYIATELNRRFGFYVIHTDWFYHPLDREPLKCVVGQEDEEKNRLIQKQRVLMTKTTILEGSHIGNKEELNIFIRELDFHGKLFIFKVESPDVKERFKKKYKEMARKNWEGINKWFSSIYNLENVVTVRDVEDVIKFLKLNSDDICISR